MTGQVWANGSDGGYMYSDQLSMIMRNAVQPAVRFRQFCDAKDATDKGLGTGDQFRWNIYTDVAVGGDQILETQTMPQTSFQVAQQSLTVTEYGNSVPYSGKLDNLSKQPVSEIIHRALKNDCTKTLDGAANFQFRQTGLWACPLGGNSTTQVSIVSNGATGFTALNTATPGSATNNAAFTKNHLKACVDTMKERNIPAYQGNDYCAIAWPTTFRQIKNDLESIHQYVTEGLRILLNGEIGRYEGTRFIEQTNVAKGGASTNSTWNFRNAVPWTNGLSDWMFIFGEDTVAEAVVIPEEIRGKIPTDFGRDRAIAWYYLGGFGLVHTQSVNSGLNQRILWWNSYA